MKVIAICIISVVAIGAVAFAHWYYDMVLKGEGEEEKDDMENPA